MRELAPAPRPQQASLPAAAGFRSQLEASLPADIVGSAEQERVGEAGRYGWLMPVTGAEERPIRLRRWLVVWSVPAVLVAAAAYEVGLVLWGSYAGLQPGEEPGGEATVSSLAVLAMLVGVIVAVVCAVRSRVPWAVALFAPAAAAFVIARFYSYDPYYFPTLRRYSDGGAVSDSWILTMVGLSIIVGAFSLLSPRSGSIATSLMLPLLLFTLFVTGIGH